MEEMRNTCTTLVTNPEGKRLRGRPSSIAIDVREMCCGHVD
jgi:hypothetical protein